MGSGVPVAKTYENLLEDSLVADASATSDQAMGLRRSMSPKEKRDAKRGDE